MAMFELYFSIRIVIFQGSIKVYKPGSETRTLAEAVTLYQLSYLGQIRRFSPEQPIW